jgi:hypothetical protein
LGTLSLGDILKINKKHVSEDGNQSSFWNVVVFSVLFFFRIPGVGQSQKTPNISQRYTSS